MFSYRHSYHAGNHADVLKHTALIAILHYMALKEVGFTVFDTHAGAGIYRLDSHEARQSGEAEAGFLALMRHRSRLHGPMSDALLAYRHMVEHFNPQGGLVNYPGSPALIQRLLRLQDQSKLFELHPTDHRLLKSFIEPANSLGDVDVVHADGFSNLAKYLPPPTRRGVVLIDPSYEVKQDYDRVAVTVSTGLQRFATGIYVIWYPVVPRPQAHRLPKHLTTLAKQAQRPWLQATLRIRSGNRPDTHPNHHVAQPKLVESGIIVINPPFTLHGQLEQALSQMVLLMGQDHFAGFTLEHG